MQCHVYLDKLWQYKNIFHLKLSVIAQTEINYIYEAEHFTDLFGQQDV